MGSAHKSYGTGEDKLTERYNYNIRGWLTDQESDLFEMKLRYNNPRTGIEPSYSGNITEWLWKHSDQNEANSFGFSYDGLSRLTANDHLGADNITATDWGEPTKQFRERGITYDLNGNIKSLRRDGYHTVTGAEATDELDLGSLIFKRGTDGLRLESTGFGGGRILASDSGNGVQYTPIYHIADHLGSTRVVWDGTNVVERNDYLPFGSRIDLPMAPVSDNPFPVQWERNTKHFQPAIPRLRLENV